LRHATGSRSRAAGRGTSLSCIRVGVEAPEAVAPKIAYALEELLAAARVPHHVERTAASSGFDLLYSRQPPEDDGVWMRAATDAWQFLERPAGRISRVVELCAAGEPVRLPDWRQERSDARGGGPGGHGSSAPVRDRAWVPDVAAAAFFFLSRWEELQASERDPFGRFPLSASVFGRGLWSLLECPVEAYARALGAALSAAPRTEWTSHAYQTDKWGIGTGSAFAVGLSHDIDSVQRWNARGFARTGREVARALLHGAGRRAIGEGRQLLAGVRCRAAGQDPHGNVEEIAAREQQSGTRSTFFLLPRHTHRWDGTHPSRYQSVLPEMARSLAQVAEVGVHASTAATTVPSLQAERQRLEELTGAPIRGVRFHNLRGGYGALPLVAAAGFAYDSTLGFAEQPGFAAGIARPFRPYDRERDVPLDLVEVPLAVMDTTLLSPRYLGLPVQAGWEQALGVLEVIRRQGGAAALLWHNDNLPPNDVAGYAALYGELIDWVRGAGGRVAPLGELVDDWKHARNSLCR
jgi:hypothetical protein